MLKLFVCGCFFLCTSSLIAAEKEVIPASLAVGRAGEKATVEFIVQASNLLAHREEPICFLNSEENYKSKDNFTVVIFSEGLKKFQKAGIKNPAEHYKGKTLLVTGEIGLRRGQPQIIVEYVGQIEIIEQRGE